MNVSCDVIRDLVPLYAEDMLSEDSVQLVETHLEYCKDCQKLLEELNQPYPAPEDHNAMPLLKIKSALRKKKTLSIALTFVFTLLFSAILFAFLTAPKYLPYSEDTIQVSDQADGSVVIIFDEQVSGYDINEYASEGGSGTTYHLTTWTTIWDEYVQSDEIGTIVLNEGAETVSSVYYYQTDGTEDRLIYGINEISNGGIVTLPRLNLSYFLMTAVLFGLISLIIALLFRRHKQIVKWSFTAFLLSISYAVAHLTVMGLSSASYSSTRDLLAIILITIPLFALILLGKDLYNMRRERKRIEKLK